ncbi:MAG TPA: FecR domain-containing protein [Mucilaginibacter sp.]
MEITEELIQKYFLQKCSPEEHQAVSAYFDQHPDRLDLYLDDESWEKFEPKVTLPPALSEKMLQNIEAAIRPAEIKPEAKTINIGRILGIAASIIAVMGIGLFFYLNQHKNVAPSLQTAKNTAVKPAVNDTVVNGSSTVKRIALADGSIITLLPKSRIINQKNFTAPKRDIYLTGEAIFKVAKDKTRPFTVYAGGLSTTALGTRFKVTAYEGDNKVKVMLYTGKVVIKRQQHTGKGDEDVYLEPGQQLEMNNGEAPKVSSFRVEKPSESDEQEASNGTVINGDGITFSNQSLKEVLNVLQQSYHITIQADDTLLTNRFYTGHVDIKTDQPESVLKTIATLNRLTLTQQGSSFTLGR